MVAWPSGVWPDLSSEDEEVKWKLVKCSLHAYSELIRSDIPRSSGARPARLPFLRPSPLSVMKPSVSKFPSPSILEPRIAKPTWGELRARMEVLAKKKRSIKRKTPTSLKGCPPARGKILKVGASSSPSSATEAGDSLRGRGAAEPPLEVLPISIWSPTSRGTAPSPAMPDKVRRDRFGVVESEDSLLSHAELSTEAVSSILRDFNLKKVDAMSIKEALALLLQGTTSVRPSAFINPFLYCLSLLTDRLYLILW